MKMSRKELLGAYKELQGCYNELNESEKKEMNTLYLSINSGSEYVITEGLLSRVKDVGDKALFGKAYPGFKKEMENRQVYKDLDKRIAQEKTTFKKEEHDNSKEARLHAAEIEQDLSELGDGIDKLSALATKERILYAKDLVKNYKETGMPVIAKKFEKVLSALNMHLMMHGESTDFLSKEFNMINEIDYIGKS
jgi:hypothetical protein